MWGSSPCSCEILAPKPPHSTAPPPGHSQGLQHAGGPAAGALRAVVPPNAGVVHAGAPAARQVEVHEVLAREGSMVKAAQVLMKRTETIAAPQDGVAFTHWLQCQRRSGSMPLPPLVKHGFQSMPHHQQQLSSYSSPGIRRSRLPAQTPPARSPSATAPGGRGRNRATDRQPVEASTRRPVR